MLAKVTSVGVLGIEAYLVDIEVDVTMGLPAVNIVGLADTAIRESKERVKAAIKNAGFQWPQDRVTINLAPSDMKKEGTSFDLAIALAVLAATEQIDVKKLDDFVVLGELSLDAYVRPVTGAFIASLFLSETKHQSKNLLLPKQNAAEAGWVAGTKVWPALTLKEAIDLVHNPGNYQPYRVPLEINKIENSYAIDFSDVKGQYFAKRALEVAAAGNHNILLIGPPGSGKTMLAQRVPTIMPDLTEEEVLEINRVHSAAGTILKRGSILFRRPFRSPHHNCSSVALAGGGTVPRPGEISLSHKGVLFLDELPEFRRDCLETLRQPLEEGCIRIARANKSVNFPASFMLVCAMNPCPCGFYTDRKRVCRCGTTKIQNYKSRISGPLLDRIDMHIEVPAARYQELTNNMPAEGSCQVRGRVQKARLIQKGRLSPEKIYLNSQMSHKQVHKYCALGNEENSLLKAAMSELNLSARAYDKILKIARTIADLAGAENISAQHLAEAIQYRSLDRSWY